MLLLFYGKGPLGPTQSREQTKPIFIYDYFKALNEALSCINFLNKISNYDVKIYDLDKDLSLIKGLDPDAEEFRALGYKYVIVVSTTIPL